MLPKTKDSPFPVKPKPQITLQATRPIYGTRSVAKGIALFILIFIIMPLIIWSYLFWVYTDPLVQVLLLPFLLGYYILFFLICYLYVPSVWGLVRHTFYGASSGEYERSVAETAISEANRGKGGNYLDANVIVSRSSRRVTVDAPASKDTAHYRVQRGRWRVVSHDMSFCPECGQPNKLDEKQCSRCATKLNTEFPLPPPPND